MSNSIKETLQKAFPDFYAAIEKWKQPTAAERIAALEAAVAEIALREAAGEVQDDV